MVLRRPARSSRRRSGPPSLPAAWLITALPLALLGVPAAALAGVPGITITPPKPAAPPSQQPLPVTPFPSWGNRPQSQMPLQPPSPLAVCPSAMSSFIRDSSSRAVPFTVATRSCNCYAEERANGATHDQSARRCFP